jgi:hypothetical protein
MSDTTPPPHAPFTSRLEQYAWRASLTTLVLVLLFMVALWE